MSFENKKRLEYRNRAELDIFACGEHHIIYSNEIDAKKIVVRVEKTENRFCVFEGDCLEYTIKICNDSLVDIEGAVFCDDIPYGLEYVSNSFKVDGVTKTPEREPFSNKISYRLRKIRAGEQVVIKFDTAVL